MVKVNDDELEGSGDLVYYLGILFTGTAVDYHPNGILASDISYEEGLTQGHWKEWSDKGRLVLDSECKEGVRHGVTKTYFENGNVKSQGDYEFGIETSYVEWDDKGNILLLRTLGPDTPGANYSLLQEFRARSENSND
jgi:antitoxin component YwqK of YwqJK toxin-antitoxin module